MKDFTHPEGFFEIKIPLEWNYVNEFFGYDNKQPFSFELYENSCGCFQISCYDKSEKKIDADFPNHKYFVNNLEFIKFSYPREDFIIHIWGTVVEDLFFMAKYVCQPDKENEAQIDRELSKVEDSLKTLIFIDKKERFQAICFDKFQKFCTSLAASFDLKNRAIYNKCFIQHIIISANQIDAYLRLCIALRLQIVENSNLFKLEYLYQGEEDKAISERNIFKKAFEQNIITQVLFDTLSKLYDQRNKVVHRYIISDIRTYELIEISYQYELKAEEVRLILQNIEEEQFSKKIGYYSSSNPHNQKSENHIKELHALVNNKHLYDDFIRDV